MRRRTLYLGEDHCLWLDHVLGARGAGLCVYGTLPASLAALGVVKTPELGFRSALWLPALAVIGLVPIALLFLLVRQRLSLWYEFADGLAARSWVIAISTLLVSTLVALATGAIRERYEWVGVQAWRGLPADLRWQPFVESFLLAVVSSIGATTLFLTAIKENSELPLLPRKDFVDQVGKLKGALRQIQQSGEWGSTSPGDRKTLSDAVDKARAAIKELMGLVPSEGRRARLYRRLDEDLKGLADAVQLVNNAAGRWDDFFAPTPPKGLNATDAARRISGQRLKGLRLDA